MKGLLNACLVMIAINVAGLMYFAIVGYTGESQETSRNLAKAISSYAEPDSNPRSLVTAENQCRFWDNSYCSRAQALRRASTLTYPPMPTLPRYLQDNDLYRGYTTARNDLSAITTAYVAFVDTSPGAAEYIDASKDFQEQSGILLGRMVNYLYDMQDSVIRKQNSQNEAVLMIQYFGLMVLLVLLCILRFRRGSLWNG